LGLWLFGVVTAALLIGLPLMFGAWVWKFIGGIVILCGGATDRYGRRLR